MSDSIYRFAELLTKAIHQIKTNSAGTKKIRVIQDEIGYALDKSGGSCIEHWRKGNLPASLADLEQLTHELVSRGGFSSLEEIQQFLVYGEHPQPHTFSAQLLSRNGRDGSSTTPLVTRRRQCHTDWGTVPDVSVFYGRQEEQATLTQWILTERCRLIAILGIGGVGKTALTAKVTQNIYEQFDAVIWRSLLNAPPVAEMLSDYIQFLSHNQQSWTPQTSLDRGIGILISLLREQRCLLVLDNIETISRNGRYDAEHKGYGQLIRQIGEGNHQSCLLLTSREKPPEIVLLDGAFSPVRCLYLRGLDPATGQTLLQDRGLHGTPASWRNLIERYSGNPFALRVVAETVREPFAGDIAKFLATGVICFDSIWDLLEQQFTHLSELEQAILYWLAIEREPMTPDRLQDRLFPPATQYEVLSALNSLRHRSLLETSVAGFTLQNVAMEYLTARFVNQVYTEIIDSNPMLLNSHAVLLAQVKEYVRDMQIRLILKPLADRILNIGKGHEIRNRLQAILNIAREAQPGHPDYTGGNVLHLLIHLGYDLTSYDLTGLTLRQVYLRNVELHKVDLAQVRFMEAAFTEAFDYIYTLGFSPDGKHLVTGSTNCEIIVWDTVYGQPEFKLGRHIDWIKSIKFSPDGNWIASGSDDHTVKIWDIAKRECRQTLLGHSDYVNALDFSPDGRVLATCDSKGQVLLWDVNTGALVNRLQVCAHPIYCISFHASGNLIAVGGFAPEIYVLDIQTGQTVKTLSGHMLHVWALAFNTTGEILVSGSEDKTVKIWDLETGICRHTLYGHTLGIRAVAFATESELVASAGLDQTIRLWNTRTGMCYKTLLGHHNWIRVVAFSPDGCQLVSAGDDYTIRYWEVHTGHLLKVVNGYSNSIFSLAVNPHQNVFATGSDDLMVRLWDTTKGNCIRTLQGHSNWIWEVSFSPDGRQLASVSEDRTVKIWDFGTGECLHTLYFDFWVRSAAIHPDGTVLACGDEEHLVTFWNLDTEECYRKLSGHRGIVHKVLFNPTGDILASCSTDQTVRLWNVHTGDCIGVFEGHDALIRYLDFSPDGQLLASAGGSEVRVWNVDNGECIAILDHETWVWDVIFSPDGKIIASSAATVQLWDVDTGQCLKVLSVHGERVHALGFDPKGELLVSGARDGSVRIWNIQTGDSLKTIYITRPYEGMNITGVAGLSEGQKSTLLTLGAVEN